MGIFYLDGCAQVSPLGDVTGEKPTPMRLLSSGGREGGITDSTAEAFSQAHNYTHGRRMTLLDHYVGEQGIMIKGGGALCSLRQCHKP